MAHFDYLKPGGVWPLFSLLTSSLMSSIDKMLFKSINGDEGGVWAPHAPGSFVPTPIIIGGDGMRVLGPFYASDAEIIITPGKSITVMALAQANFLAGSLFSLAGTTNLTGTFRVLTTGEVTIETPDGLRILTGGSGLIESGGFLTVNAGAGVDVRGQMTFYTGSVLDVAGTSTFTNTVTMTKYVNFTGVGGSLGGVRFYGETSFKAGSATFVEGPSVWGWSGDVDVTVGGTSGHPCEWTIGQYATFADDGVWSRTGTETWSGSGALVTFASGSQLRTNPGSTTVFDGRVILGQDQPTPTQDPGANNILLSTNTIKAWGLVSTNGTGGLTLLDGYNVLSLTFTTSGSVAVTFARQITANYAIVGAPLGGTAPFHVQPQNANSAFAFVMEFFQLDDVVNPGDPINGTAQAVTFAFVVIGRQT